MKFKLVYYIILGNGNYLTKQLCAKISCKVQMPIIGLVLVRRMRLVDSQFVDDFYGTHVHTG